MADFRKFLNHLRLEKPTFLLIIYPRCNFYLLSGIQSLWGSGCIKDRGKFHKTSIFCLHHHNSDFFFFFQLLRLPKFICLKCLGALLFSWCWLHNKLIPRLCFFFQCLIWSTWADKQETQRSFILFKTCNCNQFCI